MWLNQRLQEKWKERRLLLAGPEAGAQRASMDSVGGQGGAHRAGGRTWARGFITSREWGQCFGVPRLRPNWSLQTQNSRVVVSSVELLAEGHAGRQGRDSWILRAAGKILSEASIFL